MSFVVATVVPPLWKQLKDRGIRSAQEVLDAAGFYSPPIDVEALCRVLGVGLVRVEGATWSGALKSSDERAICWVDGKEAMTRQRFSIAHEIGHLFLDATGLMFRDVHGAGQNPSERAANQFAAELLMPEHMVLARSAAAGRSAAALAKIFMVSPEAMAWRLQNLGLPPK